MFFGCFLEERSLIYSNFPQNFFELIIEFMAISFKAINHKSKRLNTISNFYFPRGMQFGVCSAQPNQSFIRPYSDRQYFTFVDMTLILVSLAEEGP